MGDERYPRTVSHVGVTVPDLEKAIEWYEDVLGWTHIAGPDEVVKGEGYWSEQTDNLLGETDFESVRIAQVTSGNGVGFEFQEYASATDRADPHPTDTGYFHVCVVDPDVAGLAEKIDESGGEHHTDVWDLQEDDETNQLTYCKDPFGNLLEINSHSYETMMGGVLTD